MNAKFLTKMLTSTLLGVSFVFLALVLLGGSVMRVSADTPVTNNITTNTTWTVAGSPYIIQTGTVFIQSGAVLTIEPGVTVKFQDASRLEVDDGQLIAIGTSAQPITFTAQNTNPVRGIWQSIQFNATKSSTIENALIEYGLEAIRVDASSTPFYFLSNTIRYAGNTDSDPSTGAAIKGTLDDSFINYNTIYSSEVGIRLNENGGDIIQNNQVYDIDYDCIAIVPGGASSNNNLFANNTAYNCGQNGISIGDTGLGANNVIVGNIISNTRNDAIEISNQGNITVTDNVIYEISQPSVNGLHFGSLQFNAVVYNNAICVDDRYEIENLTGNNLTAEGNWLGTNFPAAPPEINGSVDYTPSITLALTPANTTLPADGVSTTVVTVTMNDGNGHVVPPLARSVDLTTSLGSISPQRVTLNANGVATATLTAPLAFGQALVTATEFCNYAVTTTVAFQAADLAISKTPLITQVAPGGLISYTIHYTNQGNAAANNVVITDVLPANTTFNSASAPGWALANNTPAWTRGSLAAGQSGLITFTARVATQNLQCAAGGIPLTNTVYITSAALDADLSNNVYTTTSAQQISVLCPDVTIYKYSAQAAVSPGDTVTYTIVYSNIGDAPAYGVGITDINPLDGSAQTLPGIVSSLNPLDRYTTTYAFATDARICGRSYLTNTAVISTVTPETNYSNNRSTTYSGNSPRIENYNLAINKSPAFRRATPGQTLTYTLRYTNTGNAAAPGVVITDALPQHTFFVNSNPAPASSAGGTVVWNVSPNPLPAGADGVITLTLAISQNAPVGFITNTVNIAGSGAECNTADNQDTASIEIRYATDLSIVKNDNIGTGNIITTALAGTAISYTIQVRNGGNQTAYNVVLTETLPTNTLFAGPSGANGWFRVGSSNVYTYRVPYPLSQNLSFETEFIVTVDPGLSCAIHEVINTVRTGSSQADINLANNVSVEQTPVECVPLQLTKTTPLTLTCPGDLVDYTITVSNNNTSALTGLALWDSPDANTPFVGPPIWNNAGSGVYTYAVGTLNANQQTSVAFSVWVTPGLSSAVTAITNQVTLQPAGLRASHTLPVYHDIPDLYTVKNDNIEQLPRAALETIARIERKTGPLPWLEALKNRPLAVQAHSVSPGDIISYSIAYGNSGPYTATNVRVLETLPENTQFWGPAAPYWTHLGGRTYVYTVGTLSPGMGGQLKFRVRVDNPFPDGVPGVTNTVTIRGDEALECDSRNNISVEFTPVLSSTPPPSGVVYLPIVMKNWPPPEPTAQLSWLNQDNDHVSELDGAASGALNPDGRNDGAFSLTVDVLGYNRTIDRIEFSSSQSGIPRWNTTPGDGIIVAGVYLGGSQLNSGNGAVSRSLSGQETYTLYLSDDAGNSRFVCYPQQYNYTVVVHFEDGAFATANASIPPCPPPPPPDYPDWVSDLAVDPTTNQVFVASPRNHAVHVINGALDEYNLSVGVDNQPTGLAVMTATGKVAVGHFTTNDPTWQRGLWFIDTGTLNAHPMADQNGYVGVRPAKVAANSLTGRFYVSNYDDRLAVVDGLWELRLNWVNKTYVRPYGLKFNQGSNILYNATIDTGELIVMDGYQAENSGYNPCHNPLPDTVADGWNQADRRIQRMVAVNPNTGHIFVTSPPDPNPDNGQNDSRVYVLDEAAFLSAIGGRPSATTCGAVLGKASQTSRPRSIAAEPGVGWLPFYVNLGVANAGTEGIAVNPATNKVYVTDTDGNRVFVFQDGDSGSLMLPPQPITGFERPVGIDVNPATNKIYVANARTDSDPYGTVTVIDGASNTIIKVIRLDGGGTLPLP